MHDFNIFFKRFNELCGNFSRVWTKNTNCWKFLRKFSKVFIRILSKCITFAYFSKEFNKPCVNFLRVWTKNANCWEILKIFDENSIEKLNFYFIFNFIFQKFVTKNRAFGNNTIFLQQFFRFRGGGVSPLPPAYALANPIGMIY